MIHLETTLLEPTNRSFLGPYRVINDTEVIMVLRLLETPHLERGGQRLGIQPTKPAALLLYLAVQGDWVNREVLASVFAPDADESSARHHLRVLLNRARQFDWSASLEIEATRLRFAIENDVRAFREAIGRGDWARAVELHRRPFFEGFHIGAPAFEAWCEAEREAFARAWRDAARKRADELSPDDPAAAAHLLHGVLEHDDLAEDIVRAYLECTYLAGRREDALREYERFRGRLREELDLEPLEDTARLAEMIRRAEPLEAAPRPARAKPSVPIQVLRPPRMTGRARELEAMSASEAAVTLIAAEPGSGKTRLLEEVAPGARWLRCREGLEGVPYQPVIELVRASLTRTTGAGLRVALPDLGPYAEDLARLVPEVMPGVTLSPAEPVNVKARLLEALARALEADPAPLVADDLQWADAATLELIVFLAGRGRIRVLGAYRSDEVGASLEQTLASLRSGHNLETIRLGAIAPEAMRDLLAELIGVDEGPERFSRWLTERSGGNAFFALETLKALFESGALEERDGAWHTALDEITTDYRELEVPARVAQLVERRVLRLSEPARRVVQAASVVREGFTVKLLSGVIGLSEFAVLDALEEVEEAGLVVNARFHHDITRQSVYGGLANARRRALHLRVAEGLDGTAEPLVIAQHWLEGGEQKRAVELWAEAVPRLGELSLYDDQISVCQRILEHSPDRGRRDQARLDCIAAYQNAGRSEEAQSQIEIGVQETDDPIALARLSIIRAQHFNGLGQHRKALELLGGFDPMPEWFDEEMSEDLRWIKSTAYSYLGRYQEALSMLEPDHARYEQAQPSWKLVSSLTGIGSLYDRLGDHERALGFHQRALRMAKSIGHLYGQIYAMRNLLFTLWMLGRSEEGLEPAEELLQTRHLAETDALRGNLATTYLRLGRYVEARRHYEHLIEHSRETHWRIAALGRIAGVYSALGLGERIGPALERAIDELSTTEYPTAQGIVAIAVLEHGNEDQVARIERFLESFDLEGAQPDVRASLHEARDARKNRA